MNDVTNTAKMIKRKIKLHFPSTKFSVKSKTYSGGNSITIEWTDGPSIEMVEFYGHQYENASFDGMTDLKTYKTIDPKLNCKGTNYVFYRHNYSEELKEKAKKQYEENHKNTIQTQYPKEHEYIKEYYDNMEEWAPEELMIEKEYQIQQKAEKQAKKQKELDKQDTTPQKPIEEETPKLKKENNHLNKSQLEIADPNHIPVFEKSFNNMPFKQQVNLMAKAMLYELDRDVPKPIIQALKAHPNYPKMRINMIIARAYALQQIREEKNKKS